MPLSDTRRSYEVLAVGYSSSDTVFLQQAFRDDPVPCKLSFAGTARDAAGQLARAGTHRPDVILFALDGARRESREALEVLKREETTRRIPVIVMTSSGPADEQGLAYDLHANCFIPKPSGFDQFVRVVRSICRFWFTIVTLPRE